MTVQLPEHLRNAIVESSILTNKMMITPELAKELLKQNYANRTLRNPIVRIYAMAMKQGKWHADTTETVKIANNGRILDGQHRLHAVILANVSVAMYVAYNVPVDAVTNIDTGAKRSSKDIFDLYGIENSTQIAAVMRKYMLYTVAPSINHLQSNKEKVTTDMMLELYYNNPDMWQENIATINKFAKKIKLDYSLTGSWYLLAKDKSNIDANTFFSSLADGTNFSSEKDPILKFREYLNDLKLRKVKFDFAYNFALFVKSWNYFRRKQTVSQLRFISTERYPIME